MRDALGAAVPPGIGGRSGRRALFRRIRDGIIDGSFAGGERLPSTRVMAREHGLSRTTVEEVYDQLVSEGLVIRKVGRGSFVAPGVRPESAVRVRRNNVLPSRRGAILSADVRAREPVRLGPFNAGVPDASLFPMRAWERCRRLAMTHQDLLNCCDAQGYAPLREQLARHLVQFRGLRVDPSDIVIFASTAQALASLLLLLADTGDEILIEDPGYPVAYSAARLAGLQAVPIPTDGAGMDVEEVCRRASGARLAYVTPAHQYPTGVPLARARRAALLAWAAERKGIVIEDDYDADFRYKGQPLATLHSLDQGQRVIYLGTLSKATFLGLRIAYAAVPSALVEPLVNIRAQQDGFPPIETQATLATFIADGWLVRHIRNARRHYEDKLHRILHGLKPMRRAGWDPGPTDAGLHFVLYEPVAGEARRVAACSGLELSAVSDYASLPLARDGLLIRFGGLDDRSIDAGIAALNAAAA